MRGSRVAAVIAFILTAQCLPIPRPADAADTVTAWYRQGDEWVPIMSFRDAEACARAARALAAKSGGYIDCADGALPDTATQVGHRQPASLDVLFDGNDKTDAPKQENRGPAARRDHKSQEHSTLDCSFTGLTAVCKSY